MFLLAMRTWEEGYRSDFWLTFKQAQQKGGRVRKGEKATLIVFWKQLTKTDPETDESVQIPLLRHYNVFNAEQCDGITPPDAEQLEQHMPPLERNSAAEEIVDGYRDPPAIEHRGGRAVYRPTLDRIEIPKPELFESSESYYATLFHELSHSTGHSKRLNRGLDTTLAPFGSPDYGKEELVAEMSAAFLAAACGISPPTIAQSAAYIDNWRTVLKGDKKLVITAAGAAQKSADWILGERGEDKPSFEASSATSPGELNPEFR